MDRSRIIWVIVGVLFLVGILIAVMDERNEEKQRRDNFMQSCGADPESYEEYGSCADAYYEIFSR